jgi:hypothetical protein
VIGLARRLRARRHARGHADHLEAAILEVVRLLGVEREDAEGELLVGDTSAVICFRPSTFAAASGGGRSASTGARRRRARR